MNRLVFVEDEPLPSNKEEQFEKRQVRKGICPSCRGKLLSLDRRGRELECENCGRYWEK